jgi:hypothetical protein
MVVESQSDAKITVTGSYVSVGRTFSIDAVAKDETGAVVTRAYAQGANQDELISAVEQLASKLADGILKKDQDLANLQPAAKPQMTPPAVVSDNPPSKKDINKIQQIEKSAEFGWTSQRLTGAMRGIAAGKTSAQGERELFIASEHAVQLYRQGKELQLINEVVFPGDMKILGVDTADLDGDGDPEVYITMWNGIVLASQVWKIGEKNQQMIAGKLPYYFRGIALNGGKKTIYVQQMNSDNDFYGDVYELVKSGSSFDKAHPLKLPKYGNLYNFNTISGTRGDFNFLVLSSDGTLFVYSQDRRKLWQSKEKFGGSETYFQREDYTNTRITGESFRWVFTEQRIYVTSKGDIIVPQNAGFWSVGNNRSYSKNTVYGFGWNGSTLYKKWHTNESQNYLADYIFDETRKDLIALEVVDKPGIIEKGASAVLIRNIE